MYLETNVIPAEYNFYEWAKIAKFFGISWAFTYSLTMSIYILYFKAYTCYYCLYARNLEEVEGAYWFGPVFHTHD